MFAKRGQASFEIMLMVGFIFSLSTLIIVNYLAIAPSIEGIGVVKSAMVANLAGMEPANALQSVQYGPYMVTDLTTGVPPEERSSFTATIRDPLSSCGVIAIDDGFDQLASIGGLTKPMIKVHQKTANCQSLVMSAKINYESSATIVETPEQLAQRVQDECLAVGKTPLLLVQSFDSAGILLDSTQADVDFGSLKEQSAMVLVSPNAASVTVGFANDCCLGWNGSSCTRGGTNIEWNGIQLDQRFRNWTSPIYFTEDADLPVCMNLSTLNQC